MEIISIVAYCQCQSIEVLLPDTASGGHQSPSEGTQFNSSMIYGISVWTKSVVSSPSMTMGDTIFEELEDLMHFSVADLPARGYAVMEEIRRQGKLCDVTLKVLCFSLLGLIC